jgi:tyrosine-specific transport protein
MSASDEAVSLLERAMGKVSDDRYTVLPEYSSGQIPRLFSSLSYNLETGKAHHAAGSVVGAAALIAGTTIGAGVLALPQATAAAGFLPSSFAMISAYVYMTMSGLLIAELTMNHMGTTGKPGIGLLELYKTSLGGPLSALGSAAYFFLHYAVMVAYFAQGGVNFDNILQSIGMDGLLAVPGIGQAAFAALCGFSLYATKPSTMEKVNNALVLGVGASFIGIMAIGAQTADFSSLIDPINQHPSQVVNCLPILFLALVYQNVVPTIVNKLEGDRTKVMQAIIAGTTTPLIVFLAWNAIVLGNVAGADLGSMDPVAFLQQQQPATGGQVLGPLVGAFSSLALVTSVIGFTHGLLDAWTDVLKISPQTLQEDGESNLKASLFGLVFVPPLALSMSNPDIFYKALEYGGAFGVSVLFLFLPPIMVWRERYGEDAKPLVSKPMVPFGKLALGSMYKIAATLVLEQGAEKLGVFDFVKEHFLS